MSPAGAEGKTTRAEQLRSLRIERTAGVAVPRRGVLARSGVAAVCLGLATLGLVSARRFRSAPEVGVVIARSLPPAGRQTILQVNGYVVPAHKIEVATKVAGRVMWIGVDKGDRVRTGQEIARLEDAEYRAQLDQQRGQQASLEARLREALAGNRPEEVEEARANVDQVMAEARNLQVKVDRERGLVDAGALSRQALEDDESRLASVLARLQSTRQRYELARKGTRAEQVDALRAQLEQARATVEFFSIQLADTVIRSPIDGTIIERGVEKGEYVSNGSSGQRGARSYVVSVADLRDLEVELDISQADFSRLGSRQRGLITVEAYAGREYHGVISSIAPEANRQKGTVQVKVRILNADRLLRPEMNATVSFIADGSRRNAEPGVLVPAGAVRHGAVLLVVGGRVELRPVTAAAYSDGWLRITSGLAGGEEVISEPSPELRPNQRVRSIRSAP